MWTDAANVELLSKRDTERPPEGVTEALVEETIVLRHLGHAGRETR